MKVIKMMLILVAVFAVFLFASGQGYSAPITFTGIDLVDSSGPRPNSNAAAANFDAAAALLGPVNVITFEGLTVGSSSFTAASGVNVVYSGDYWISVGAYYSGVNNHVNDVWGFNTTASGSQYLGLAIQPAVGSLTDKIASITFSFDQPINAFGGYFSGLESIPGPITLNYMTVGGTYSLPIVKPTVEDDEIGLRFFGIIDTDPISQIILREIIPVGVSQTDWWGLDDVRYASSSAAPVPEPATMLLIGSGLVGLAGLRKKFKK